MEETNVDEISEIDEVHGKLKKQDEEDKLMNTILQSDKEELDHGRVIAESINQGINSFTPDMIFRNLVKNFQMAKNLYGETLIRKLSGYDPNYIKKNINIPEFKKQLGENIEKNVEELKQKKFLDRDGVITSDALKLSSLIMYMEELNKLKLKGFGEKRERKKDSYGHKEDIKEYNRERYKDLAWKQSLKTALRREHKNLSRKDLRVYERRKKGKINLIYALDSSGSMKGPKIGTAKKAGIALAYKAIQEKNKVGLIVFGSEIKTKVEPCQDFKLLLEELAKIRAGMETDIANTIKESVDLFPKTKVTKHLILISDALPTKGEEPVTETLEAVSYARDSKVTISVIGINLDKDGLKLAKKIVEIGDGRLYSVKNLEDMDAMVLEDYYLT